MDKNEDRRWPAPADQVPGQPVEHIRDEELHFDAVIAALTPGPALPILESERAEWRADNERLRAERQEIRRILGAQPHEGALEAAKRVAAAADYAISVMHRICEVEP